MPHLIAFLTAAMLSAPHEAADTLPPIEPSRTVLMPRALTSFGAATLDDWLYVHGGFSGARHEYCIEDQARQLWRFNLRDRATWELVGDIEPVQSVALVAHERTLISVGGMHALNARGDEQRLASSALVRRFDPRTRAWSRLPDLPAPRSSHAAALIGDQLYVVGGWSLGGELGRDSQWHAQGCVLDLADASATWRAFEVPFQRRGLALVAKAGKLYALGGMHADGETSTRVDVFDPASERWSSAQELPEHGFGVAACVAGDALIASGAAGDVWRLSAAEDAWQTLAPLAWPRMFHQLLALDERQVVALGGSSRAGHTRALEFIELDPGDFACEHVELPAPGSARNRQAWFLRGSTLFAFGGNVAAGQHAFEPQNFASEGWAFDLNAWQWRPVAALPVARQSLESTSIGGAALLALGGFGYAGESLRSHAEGFVYDFDADRWASAGTLLPSPRSQFGLASFGGESWIFGGLDYVRGRGASGDFEHPLAVLKRADDAPATRAFEASGVELPGARRAFAGAELDGRYYLVGGLRDGFESVAEVDVFDFESRTWSTVPAPRSTRIGAQLVALHGRLYLVGGTAHTADGGSAPQRALESFDPATGSWSSTPLELPFEPHHIRAFAWRERLLVVSTHDEARPTLRLALLRVP